MSAWGEGSWMWDLSVHRFPEYTLEATTSTRLALWMSDKFDKYQSRMKKR